MMRNTASSSVSAVCHGLRDILPVLAFSPDDELRIKHYSYFTGRENETP